MILKIFFPFLIAFPLLVEAADSSPSEPKGFWGLFRRPNKEQQTSQQPPPPSLFSPQGALQVRAGYFQFTSNWAQEIYGAGAPDIELEGSVKLHPYLSLWGNLNYVWKGGDSTPFENTTHLDLVTLSLGANAMAPLGCSFTFIYLGFGISGAYVHTKDESPYLPTHTSKFGVGCVGKFGFLVFCSKHFFVNPFFDYYYQPIHARNTGIHSQVNLGGFRTGLGVGYQF